MLRFSVSAQLLFPMRPCVWDGTGWNIIWQSFEKKATRRQKKNRIPSGTCVQEIYARGFEFLPIDIYRSHANRFQIIDGKLLPPLNSIDGMGDKAAEAVVEAAKQGKFLSKDDFRDRTKVSKTVIDLMDDLGLFGDIPQSNQFSLFDVV